MKLTQNQKPDTCDLSQNYYGLICNLFNYFVLDV